MDKTKTFEGTQAGVSTDIVLSGSSFETIVGAGAVILAILSLLGVLVSILLPIAVIAASAGLLSQGSSIASGYSELLNSMEINSSMEQNGTSTEILVGIVGVVLGILALIGLVPYLLMSISAIVLGCGLMVSSRSLSRLKHFQIRASVDNISDQKWCVNLSTLLPVLIC